MKDALELLTSDPFRVAFYCWCGAFVAMVLCVIALIVETARGHRVQEDYETWYADQSVAPPRTGTRTGARHGRR